MPFLSPALPFSTSEDQTQVKNIREPTTQYLLLNSKDRGFAPVIATVGPVPTPFKIQQPWNNFRLQKNEPLMTAFARRVQVAEVRFPWSIPNITTYNNKIWYQRNGGALTQITLNPGFYTPAQIATAIQAAFPPASITVTYSGTTQSFTFTTDAGSDLVLYYDITLPAFKDFYQFPSLFKTLGLPVQYSGYLLPISSSLTGNPTNASYTDYVDITSDKMMTYTDVRDGSSTEGAASSIIARLYANDEVSVPATNPITSAPFYIHRQFKNAKNIKWNPEAIIDWCDIQVYDMWGNLVYLPTNPIPQASPTPQVPAFYPDFQITLLASEQ
jgi:hypothetical protein